jgi:hypothetical protein
MMMTSDQERFLQEQRLLVASRCRAIRKQIETTVCKVVGPGPHRLRFGVARTVADCKRIVNIYKQQFIYPGESELRKTLVLPPRQLSTKTRAAPRVGNFHWFIVFEETGDVACCASVNVHAVVAGGREDRVVFEMPLFATAAGYKNLGLARLLNAAVQELAIQMGAEVVIVSADEDAVPFWTSPKLGQPYAPLPPQRRPPCWETMCHHFGDSVCLGWTPAALGGGTTLIDAALASLRNRFVIGGSVKLPMP